MSEQSFRVTITFNIERDGKPFANTTQVYPDMSYDAMQLTQGTVVRSLLALGDARMTKVG